MPVVPLHSLTSQSLDAKFANKQRRYQTKYSASYLHQPAPPPRLAAPSRPPNPMFEALRAAAAQLDLPEEHEQHDLLKAAAILPTERHPVRKALLGTTAALALCALAASGYYAWVLRGPDGSLASSRTVLAALEQRFQDLTADQAVFHAIGEKIALWRPVLFTIGPAVPPVREAAAEIPSLQPAQPVMAPTVPAAAVPGQPALAASLSPPSAAPDASSPTEAASSRPPKPSEPVASTPEAAGQATPAPAQAEPVPPNAAEAAATPMPSVVTAQQLVNTFALVRQMGLLVRDMQAENEKLRTQVAGLAGTLQTKVTDLEQRLAAAAHDMRDAHEENAQLHARMATLADTLQASNKASEQRLSLALARSPAAEPGKRQAEAPASAGDGNAAAADATASGLARTVRDYRVQAASLGVAVLGDANAAPGQADRHLVAVGDQVPGVGRVISITQRGTAWVVQTDHGAIQ